MKKFIIGISLTAMISASTRAQKPTSNAKLEAAIKRIEPKCIAWRRQLHEHPELSNREVNTANLIAEQLKSLGIEVREGVAHTGVIGVHF